MIENVNEKILRHLTRGWQTLVSILSAATHAGIKIPPDEVERLERMQVELGIVIQHQKALK